VADTVTVVTKAADGEQLRWESEAANKYSISADDSEPIEGSGTRLILQLKEDADKYLEEYTLRDMLKRYSEFISFPIELWAEKTEYDTIPDPDAEVKEGEEPPTKTVPRTSNVWEKVNIAKPLWMRKPKEVGRRSTPSSTRRPSSSTTRPPRTCTFRSKAKWSSVRCSLCPRRCHGSSRRTCSTRR